MFSSNLVIVGMLTSLSASVSVHHHVHSHIHTRLPTIKDANITISERATGGYTLKDSYTAGNFFQNFDFFPWDDPTHGYVSYQTEGDAWAKGLINMNDGQVYMGVDTTTVNPGGRGRASVRIESKKSWNHGLFIADIAHMPGSACGIWPAYWLFGPNWPSSGEIDILEGVHNQPTNAITLHTAPGCYANIGGSNGGTNLGNPDCNFNNAYQGCSASTTAPFGDNFNAGGGGVYAMQWESSGIYVWFFPRYAIPGDIQDLRPDTTRWGTPLVAFNGGGNCDIDRYFQNQKIIFDTTFCGDWAGGVWGQSGCASKASTCEAYVAQNPSAFNNGYWKINSVRVYQ